MRKIYALLLTIFVGLACTFAACGDPYKDMKMELISEQSVEILLTENVEVDVPEGEFDPNTAEVKVKISGVDEDISKEVLFTSSDTSKLRVKHTELVDDVTTAEIVAYKPGNVDLYINSKEGGKKLTVRVNIVRKVSAVAFDASYAPAVVAGGATLTIDTTKLLFTPSDANVRDCEFALVDALEGFSIDENGVLTAANESTDSVKVRVTPKFRETDEVYAEIDVRVLPKVDNADVGFSGTFGDGEEPLTDRMQWVKNDPTKSYYTVTFNHTNETVKDRLRIRANISNIEFLTEKESSRTNTSVTLSPIDSGVVRVDFEIYYSGYEDLVVATRSIEFEIVDAVTSIKANDSVSEITIFNSTEGNAKYGTELVVTLAPNSASNRKFTLEIEQSVKDRLFIVDALGGKIGNENGEIESGTKMRLSHDGSMANNEFTFNICPVGEALCEKFTIKVNCLTAVAKVNVDKSVMLWYSEAAAAGVDRELEYTIEPEGAKKSTVEVVSSNPQVAQVYFDQASETHRIKALNTGFSTLTFLVGGRSFASTSVEVVAPYENFFARINSPKDDRNVIERKMSNVNHGDDVIGQTVQSAIIEVGGRVKINVDSYPATAKIQSVEYRIESVDGISASRAKIVDGYLMAESSIEKFNVVVKVIGYTYDPETGRLIASEAMEKVISFAAIVSIRSISLNKTNITVTDFNSLGIAEVEKSRETLYASITPQNATVKARNVQWKVKETQYQDIIKVQEDGGVLVTGKLLGSDGNSRTVTVIASITEYSKTYSAECLVTIKRAKTVENILLSDYDNARGVYLRSTNATAGSRDSYQIRASAVPADADNTNFVYCAFDITKTSDVDNWFTNEAYYTRANESTLIDVSSTGLITPKSGAGGYAVVWVIPADNIKTDPINYAQITMKRVVLVRIADGSVDAPYEILNYTDLLAINTALDKSYVLAQSVDLLGITDFAPIGSKDNPFTGTLSGKYVTTDGRTIINSITNLRLNVSGENGGNYGLFAALGDGEAAVSTAKVSDLTISLIASNFEVALAAGENAYYGVVAGVNYGEITNVKVRFNASLTIKTTKSGSATLVGYAIVGGVAGVNYGVIKNSASVTYSKFGVVVDNASTAGAKIGGVCGENRGQVLGQFYFSGDLLTPSTAEVSYNVDYNDETINSSIYLTSTSQNTYIGGICAVNRNIINGAYSSAVISAPANVGGICADNYASILSVRFTGFIKANKNVGGVAGVNNNGTITFGIVEICDDKVHFENYDNSAVENYGGVVGSNVSGQVKYSFINSYSAQRDVNNNNKDFNITSTSVSRFGAFAGQNMGTITKSFANVQLNTSVQHIFIGINGGTASSCYTLSYAGDYVSTNQTIYSETASDFTTQAGMNFGKKIIVIGSDVSERGNVLLTESPESVDVKIYGELNKANRGKTNDGNRYYKNSDKQLILFYNSGSAATEAHNTYKLNNLFNVVVTPNTNRNKNIVVSVIEGQNIVDVEGANIITKGRGRAVLRFACDLDQSVYDDIEVYVDYGITSLTVENISSRQEDNQIYNELKMSIESVFDFDIVNHNTEISGNAQNNFAALSSGGYLFWFDEIDVAEFDMAMANSEKSVFVAYQNSKIMRALRACTSSARIYPYISAQFSNGTSVVETKVVLSDIYYSYDLIIYRGLSNIDLQSSSEEIMPNTTLNYNVVLTTDLTSDKVDFVRIYNGEKTSEKLENGDYEQFNYNIATGAIVDALTGQANKQISQRSKFEMQILSANFDDVNNEKTFVFEIIPSKAVDGELAILTSEVYTIEFGVTYANGSQVTKTFQLTIKPQALSSIIVNHYNDGADFDVNLTGAGEEVSQKIISGQYGLLVVNVWPEYSVFDRLEIVSSVAQGDVITFEQVYYNVDNNNYDTKVQNTQLVENGISVKRQSTKKNVGGQDEFAFDGRIFLRTLTGSIVATGQVFTVTISAYYENATTPYLTQSIELTALQAPYLEFNLTNGRNYKSLGHEYYMAYSVGAEFTAVTDAAVNATTGIASRITDENGDVVTDVALTKVGDSVIANGRQTLKYIIIANDKLEVGKVYNVELVVTRTVGGITTKTRIVNKLHIVDFLIVGFDIVDGETGEVLVSDGTLSQPLSTVGWQIVIKLKTLCSDVKQANVVKIEDQLNGKQKIAGRYYNPWKYKVLSGTGVGQFATIDSADVSNNFTLVNTNDGQGYRLIGRNIANVDTLMADFSYYYNDGKLALQTSVLDPIDGNPSTQFRLDFSLSTSEDHPLPIYNRDEFLAMEEGIDYILLNDIDLGYSYVPLNTAINSLDGNGYTISIRSFSTVTDDASATAINLGLFGTVDARTTLKNVTVRLAQKMTYDLQDYTTVNFGVIAGANAGIITNACVDQELDGTELLEQIILVQSSSETSTITANIAGLVGTNSGTITNSRVECLNLTASGNVGGLVAQNSATISSSYVLEPVISSTSGMTGGFVAVNSGEINTSYVRGRYVEDSLRANNGNYGLLETVGQVGGFVCENYGTINDSYANIKITSQFRSAGFVYKNGARSVIYNCLSLSDIIQNSIAHMPFVGTDSTDRFLNEGTLTNAYYYRYSDENGNGDRFVDYDIDGNKNPAQVMAADDLRTTTSLAGFAFSNQSAEFSGVWVQPTTTESAYFNARTSFGAVGTIAGFEKLSFKVGVPELVAPNVIARSVRRIDKIETNDTTGESIYNYTYVTQSNFNVAENEKYGCAYGTIHNPALIGSAKDFVSTYEVTNNGNFVTKSSMNSRVIKDVDFSEYEEVLKTPKVDFSGIIEGNGLAMRNISVVSNVDEKADRFGLFKSIVGDSNSLTNNISAVKNLQFEFIEVKSASSNIVGSVAGSLTNANLIDINVLGNKVAVKGANIVGGVVGLVDGNSKLFHITTNISVNSGYRDSGNEYIDVDDETRINTKNALYANDSMFYGADDLPETNTKFIKNLYEYVSYAGAIAGVIDTKSDETIMECYLAPNVYDVSVSGNVKVIGATAGGVFGMVGLYTYVSNVEFIIETSSYISGDDFAGGIVGELRGKLAQAKIEHAKQSEIDKLAFGATSDDINLTLFKKNSTTKASGGLVGFNFGGTILDSISHAYVRNAQSNIAGGAVGITISGDIKAVVASGSVLGRTSVGGLIGAIVSTYETGASFYNKALLPLYFDREMNIDCTLNFDPVYDNDIITQKDQNSMVLSYVMAGNNWTTSDQETLATIQNWGGLIGNYDTNLTKTYINTTHPKDKESRVNLINFYVAGANDKTMLSTRGNEGETDDWMHIAEPIAFAELNSDNLEKFYGSYYRFVWDITGEGKYPQIDIKAVPETIPVESASDLLQIIWNLSGDYLITDDIDLADIDSWLPLGTEKEPFSGSLRSDVKVKNGTHQTKNTYYQIQNLKIVASNLQHVGLFGVTGYNYKTKSGATFENLVITVEQIVGKDFGDTSAHIGALVADARGATIKNVVTTKASKDAMIVSSSEYTGGIVGVLENLLVEDDESETENAKRIITSSVEECLSSLDIGILKRDTSVAGGKIAKVGGVVGQINAGLIKATASNQKIGIVEKTSDEVSGLVSYKMLDQSNTYNGEYYNMSLYIGGLVGANGSQMLTTHEGAAMQDITMKQSFSNSSIEVLALNLYSENKIDTVVGGFIGQVNENAKISNSYASGSITVDGKTTGETVTNSIVISGFAGQIVVPQITSGENVISSSYSLVTLLDNSNTATIKGFAQIMGQDNSNLVDITNNSNSQFIANNCVYEHYYALVVDYDENFGTSSAGLINRFSGEENFKADPTLYYPVLGVGSYTLGINDRTADFAVYGDTKGSKLNPITLSQSTDLLNITDFATGSEEYNYYLVTGDVTDIPTHVYDDNGNVISNNSPMISEFYGFLNGNGYSVNGFTVKESPKVFDEDYEEVVDTLGIENVGLFRTLKKGSCISGLSLTDVYIDFQSSSTINNSVMNVAGLVGKMEKGAIIFASTVSGEIFAKGAQAYENISEVKTLVSKNQTLNVGGLVGDMEGGSLINCGNYARIASFDYKVYKNAGSAGAKSLQTLNAGGLAGKITDGSSLVNIFSISQMNYNDTNSDNISVGYIAGYAKDSTIKSYYGKVEVVKQEYTNSVKLASNVGNNVTSTEGRSTNIIQNELIQNIGAVTADDLKYNYGYEYNPLLAENVPKTSIREGELEYYIPVNTETMMNLMKGDYNIKLQGDIYIDSSAVFMQGTLNETVPVNNLTAATYSGTIDGDYNRVYGLKGVLTLNLSGKLTNIGFSGTNSYNITTPDANGDVLGNVVKVVDSSATVSVVDLCITDNNLGLARSFNSGYIRRDLNIANDLKNKLSSDLWMNMSATNDASEDRLRPFVEYWDEIDVRGVYLETNEATKTVDLSRAAGEGATSSESGEGSSDPSTGEGSGTVKEWRNNIKDTYQLAKYAKLINDGDVFELKVTELDHTSVFDLSGKIWSSLINETNTILSTSENVNEKAKIQNLYVEGVNNLGFISTYNSPSGKISNLEFVNAKIVNYGMTETSQLENIGVVAGNVLNGDADNIKVSGVVNIDVPKANYVGVAFGKTAGNLEYIDTTATAEDVLSSKVKGLDFVGSIAGSLILASKTASYVDNNYTIQGRDFVGGLFGYTTGSNNPNIYFYEKKTVEAVVTTTYHKNAGEVYGRNFVGGVVGYNGETTLNLPSNAGNVSAVGYAVGGIAGYSSSKIFSAQNGDNNTANKSIYYNDLIEVSDLPQTELAQTRTEYFEEIALADATYSVTSAGVGYFFGGIVGYLDKTDIRADISNGDSSSRPNVNYAKIEAKSFVGGIVGYNRAGSLYAKNVYLESVDNSTLGLRNYASIIGESFVGGIAGISLNVDDKLATIKDSIVDIRNAGRVIVGKYCVGGVVGANYGQLWSVAATGNMAGQTTNYGGIVGYNAQGGDVQYVNSSMVMTISANDFSMSLAASVTMSGVETNYYVGGVVGHNVGVLKKASYNNGGSGAADAGTIKFAVANDLTSVTAQNVYIGGIVGVNSGTVEQVYTDANTTLIYSTYEGVTIGGDVHIGGLVGLNSKSATIKDSYSIAKIVNYYNAKLQGSVTETEIASVGSEVAGGLVYDNRGSITSCYSTYCTYAVNTGTVSDDCYVMALKTIQKTVSEGSSTTTKSVLNYTVDDSISGNVDSFYKFMKNKFVIADVDIAEIFVDDYRMMMGYEAQTIGIKFESIDGTFADTDYLVNIKDVIIDKYVQFYYSASIFNCNCDVSVGCDCALRGCCDAACACRLGSDIAAHSPNCFHKHKEMWLEYFNESKSGKAQEFIDSVSHQMFQDVVFNLAYTGVNTPTNKDTEGNSQNASPSLTTMPTTGFIGKGTQSDPYRIYSVDDFDTLNRQLEFGNSFIGKTFKLMRDIDLSGARLSISSSDYSFQGVFDGNGKTIYNNVISDESNDNVGLFQVLGGGGQIKNLTLVDCTSAGVNNVALLVGKNLGEVKDITVHASTTHAKVTGTENVGALVGYNLGSIEGCSVGAEVIGTRNVGIITGLNSSGRVFACETILTHVTADSTSINNQSSAEGTENVGGIVGYNQGIGTISQCSNEGAVSCSSGYGGGIVGLSDARVISETYHAISDVINSGSLMGGGRLGQLGGRIAENAYNVLVTSNVRALGEASASVVNCYVVDGSNTVLYQNNALKTQVYAGFDFDNVWGMSSTELNVSTNQYSYPSLKTGEYNYPKLRNLKTSKELDAQRGGYFINQYFNTDDVDSTNPTFYVESQYQFEVFINYFLGELIVKDHYDPMVVPDEENEGAVVQVYRQDRALWASISSNAQYLMTSKTFKLYKSALNAMEASNKPAAYNDSQSFSSWTTLDGTFNTTLDFSGITISIASFDDKYLLGDNDGWSYGGFMATFSGTTSSLNPLDRKASAIKNLNLEFSHAAASYHFGGIVASLGNADIIDCSVAYKGTAPITYGDGSLQVSSFAGAIAGSVHRETDEDSTYGVIKNCSSSGITNETFVNYASVVLDTNLSGKKPLI